MKKIITLALLALALTASAQTAQIVASAGDKLSTTSISIEFTVGDLAVEPWEQGSLRLFQGFQAANYGLTLVTGLEKETMFSFYPNPTQKFLNIEADLTPGSTFHITDISGKNFELPTELTAHKAVVDVSTLPASLYVLTIRDHSGIAYRIKFIKAL
ncbi:MAG: T9SS type A sorting domain-containing protein [Bacteroidota bacterium]